MTNDAVTSAAAGHSRRRFLQLAGATLGGLSVAATLPAAVLGASGRAAAASKPTVTILGGGVGGLTAAHELAERGYAVTVYEPKALGGKARSIPVPGTGSSGRRDLPGEHGFRFFPGFYQNVPDTMRRIPYAGNTNGVLDNLVNATQDALVFNNPNGGLYVVPDFGAPQGVSQAQQSLIAGLSILKGVPANEIEYFVRKLLVYFTSCDARRLGEWDNVAWWTFTNAANFSPEYQAALAQGLTRNLVAAKATVASTHTIGLIAEAFVMSVAGQQSHSPELFGNYGAADRVLNGPTSEVWIEPWVRHLKSLGVRFVLGQKAVALNASGGKIASVTLQEENGNRHTIDVGSVICAMPVEQIRPLVSRAVLKADPSLASLGSLQTDWMNGIQFYLNRSQPHPIAGHAAYMNSPWALTSLTQGQFWTGHNIATHYGDGTVTDILSVDISDWITPGILYGKPANLCSPRQIANEVWAQIKAALNSTGDSELTDDMLVRWFLDPAITHPNGEGKLAANAEPLLINTVGSWKQRPQAATKIPNLYLASDYVQTNVNLATMEGANEAGRQAANAVLARTGSTATPADLYNLYDPPEFTLERQADAALYALGLPNALDALPASLPL